MRAVAYRFTSELRARWRAWLVLGLLVGAVAGTSLVLIAGSRRTGSAHERFVVAQRAYDVGLDVHCRSGASAAARQSDCRDAVTRLPAIADATTLSDLPAFIETLDGRSIQPDPSDPCYSGPGLVHAVFDASGRFGSTINRSHFVAGRAANPAAADEVVVSQDMAHRLHLRPGRGLRIRLFGGADCLDERATWRAPQRVRVVGVQISPGEIRTPSGDFFQSVALTPAFGRRVGSVPDGQHYLAARLRAGASPGTLRAQARKAGLDIEVVVSQTENTSAVNRAIRPNAVSLAILAALTALAGAAVLGQLLVRQASVEAGDDGLLSALGMSARERVGLAALRGATVGLVAAAVGCVTAVAASPLMPVGLARRIEPDPGVAVDVAILGLGALVTVFFVTVVTAATVAMRRPRREVRTRAKPGALAGAVARAGFSPAAVSGARLALERGGGSSAVPVASSFVGLMIAVAAVVGSITFGAGLTHLRATPRLTGWNWDVVLTYPEVSDPNAMSLAEARTRTREALRTRGITDVAMGTVWSPFPQGRDLQIGPGRGAVGGFVAFDGRAKLGPSIITGRKPAAPDEILLGPQTLSELGLRVGGEIDVVGQAGTWDHPGKETSTRMTIVGVGLAPMTVSLGRGATLTLDGLRRLSPGVTEQAWFIRLAPGTERATVIDAFAAAFPDVARQAITPFDIDTLPAAALNLEQIESVPTLFAIIMGTMAAAVLAHVLTVTARARRRDLAILRTLGFSRGQTLRTIAWQSTVYAGGALAVGIPAGIALGRVAWLAYAGNLGVVPEAITPLAACGAVAAASFLLAGLVALAPALRAARTRPAEALRSE